MADDRPLVEQLLDVALYAPIGAVVAAAERVPGLVTKGRRSVEGQVNLARMVGRMSVGVARKRIDETLGARRAGPSASEAETTETVEEPEAPASEAAPAPAVEDLAIPGYDSLAASQVIPRLDSLSRDELDDIRRYEEATRRRRTILGRIAQLRDNSDA